ncbi:MAG: 16S rRNA (guanine(966)-N(2))-methyltransferase RsmD [Alphaproteobacteria bacterium]|nr:MAG: 16S rRNA (guanine(966)-N(2))-methyltransferase RsmD [Alphaproteobacteria bacterium]
MRIIGGEFRGRKLFPPTGKNIRPTSDRMRETIFNILEHSSGGLEDANILDVFAGTGAMGLEALSRGAAHVTFFDRDRAALQLVKKNIALLNAGDRSTLKNVTAPDFPPARVPFDFIFLDPPYNLDILSDTLCALNKNKYFAGRVMVIAEYARDNIVIFPDYFEVIKEKTYGDARFSFLKKNS